MWEYWEWRAMKRNRHSVVKYTPLMALGVVFIVIACELIYLDVKRSTDPLSDFLQRPQPHRR